MLERTLYFASYCYGFAMIAKFIKHYIAYRKNANRKGLSDERFRMIFASLCFILGVLFFAYYLWFSVQAESVDALEKTLVPIVGLVLLSMSNTGFIGEEKT